MFLPPKPKRLSLLRPLNRLGRSLGKRLFWRQHLDEARQIIQAMIRELPTVEMMLTIPAHFRGQGYYRTLELKQNMIELLGLVNVLRGHKLECVCEIGTFRGGTLFIWCRLAAPDAKIFSIDLPGGAYGGGYTERSVPFFESFCKPGQTLCCLRGDSHQAKLREEFARALNGRQLDFLFIDGDHTYAGVRQDFDDYSPFVRTGGLVAFHDVAPRPDEPTIQVDRFWNELKAAHPHAEFIETSPERRQIGLGLIYL
jgi:hypothetical protein